jgi:hypothetical protein
VIRDVLVGLGLGQGFWNLSELGGATLRAELATAQRRIGEIQDVLVQRLLNRAWNWVTSVGIQNKDIPPSIDFWRVEWVRPSAITVDYGRDTRADIQQLDKGVSTMRDFTGSDGLHWESVRAQVEKENNDLLIRAKRLAETHDIELELALSLMSKQNQNASVPGAEQRNEVL